jgi:hypothetical protein
LTKAFIAKYDENAASLGGYKYSKDSWLEFLSLWISLLFRCQFDLFLITVKLNDNKLSYHERMFPFFFGPKSMFST